MWIKYIFKEKNGQDSEVRILLLVSQELMVKSVEQLPLEFESLAPVSQVPSIRLPLPHGKLLGLVLLLCTSHGGVLGMGSSFWEEEASKS